MAAHQHPSRWRAAVVVVSVISLFVALVLAASFPDNYLRSQHVFEEASPDHPSVLPVAPGDVPTECSTPGSSCGPERYCAVDPTTSSADNNGQYYCLHKSLLQLSVRDVASFLLVAGCCFLAAMAGIGGGGLLLPLLVMMTNFTPKEAIVLSHAGVFGNCLGQATFLVVRFWSHRRGRMQQHGGGVDEEGEQDGHSQYQDMEEDRNDERSKDKLLYAPVSAAVLLILPPLLAGGSAAITLQGLVPSTAILILALLTLTAGVVKTTMKARKMWKEEEDAALGQADLMSDNDEEGENDNLDEEVNDDARAFEYRAMNSRVSDTSYNNEDAAATTGTNTEPETMNDSCCRGIFCCTVERLIVSCWILDAATFLIQRSGSIRKCSPAYFAVVLLPVMIALIFVWSGRSLLLNKIQRGSGASIGRGNPTSEVDEDANYSGDQSADMRPKEFDVLVWWLPLAAFGVGLISALLGIGGGEILGPTLLLLNMNPIHSSTTTSVVALLNSGTNTLHNATAGLIISPGYFAVILSVGLVFGVFGRAFAMILSTRSGKNSVIAISLVILLTIAAGLVAFELFTTPPEWTSEGAC